MSIFESVTIKDVKIEIGEMIRLIRKKRGLSQHEVTDKNFEKISIIEQLAYVANRGMGALEYRPGKQFPKTPPSTWMRLPKF